MLKAIATYFSPAAVLGMALAIPAFATNVTIGATAPGNYSSTTFLPGNMTSGAGNWNFGGTSQTATSSISGSCVDPFGSGVTAGYVCAKAGTTVTANFNAGIAGLDLTWGSPDGYNTLTFYTGLNATGTAEAFVPGVAPLTVSVAPLAAPVLFVAAPGVTWQSVTYSSAFNSFEFGNVATLASSSSSAPEPSTIALFLSGLLSLAAGFVRKTSNK